MLPKWAVKIFFVFLNTSEKPLTLADYLGNHYSRPWWSFLIIRGMNPRVKLARNGWIRQKKLQSTQTAHLFYKPLHNFLHIFNIFPSVSSSTNTQDMLQCLHFFLWHGSVCNVSISSALWHHTCSLLWDVNRYDEIHCQARAILLFCWGKCVKVPYFCKLNHMSPGLRARGDGERVGGEDWRAASLAWWARSALGSQKSN